MAHVYLAGLKNVVSKYDFGPGRAHAGGPIWGVPGNFGIGSHPRGNLGIFRAGKIFWVLGNPEGVSGGLVP
jgi:hypothetical protein